MTRLALTLALLTGCSAGRTVYLDRDLPEPVKSAFVEASDDWNRSLNMPALSVLETDNPRAGYLKPASAIVLAIADESAYETVQQPAYTQDVGLWSRVAVRPSTGRETPDYQRWIARHELGHVLGLEHETEKCNLMESWYSSCDDTADLTLTKSQKRRARWFAALEALFQL